MYWKSFVWGNFVDQQTTNLKVDLNTFKQKVHVKVILQFTNLGAIQHVLQMT